MEEEIEAAIFAERGWEREARGPREKLLLMGRRTVVRGFGGVLPRYPGLGLPEQKERAPLTRWLRGEKQDLDAKLLPQIRILFREVARMEETEIDFLIEKAMRP